MIDTNLILFITLQPIQLLNLLFKISIWYSFLQHWRRISLRFLFCLFCPFFRVFFRRNRFKWNFYNKLLVFHTNLFQLCFPSFIIISNNLSGYSVLKFYHIFRKRTYCAWSAWIHLSSFNQSFIGFLFILLYFFWWLKIDLLIDKASIILIFPRW